MSVSEIVISVRDRATKHHLQANYTFVWNTGKFLKLSKRLIKGCRKKVIWVSGIFEYVEYNWNKYGQQD